MFDSLSAIRHERELSLVLTCRVTAAQKLYIRSLNRYGLKNALFQHDKHNNQNQTDVFWPSSEVGAVKAQLYSGKGGGEQQLICIERDMHENSMFLLPLKIGIFKMI